MKRNNWLNDYARNVYSQNGEDGIIEQILERLPERNGWCVEFGAWDGRHLSNTYQLIDNKGYAAVLIESDAGRYNDLVALQEKHPKITPLNALVWTEGSNALDQLLAGTQAPQDLDLLSVDIDGNDYYVWEALQHFRPKIVCIEFNPTIPTQVDFVQKKDPGLQQGCSLLALYRLGHQKGYELVATTLTNAIFVEATYFPLFEIQDNAPHILRADDSKVTYIFHGYDGQVYLHGQRRILWHGLKMYDHDVQIIPRFLRKYPLEMNPIQRFFVSIFKGLRHIKALLYGAE